MLRYKENIRWMLRYSYYKKCWFSDEWKKGVKVILIILKII